MRSFQARLLCSLLLCLILCAILPACDRGQEPNSPAEAVTATPEEVLATLAPEATPLAISDVCTRIAMPLLAYKFTCSKYKFSQLCANIVSPIVIECANTVLVPTGALVMLILKVILIVWSPKYSTLEINLLALCMYAKFPFVLGKPDVLLNSKYSMT